MEGNTISCPLISSTLSYLNQTHRQSIRYLIFHTSQLPRRLSTRSLLKSKMLGPVARISNRLGQNVMKMTIRNGSRGGIPGENLPFDINNKARLTFHMFWFFGTGFAAPFVVMWHQMRKNANK